MIFRESIHVKRILRKQNLTVRATLEMGKNVLLNISAVLNAHLIRGTSIYGILYMG